MADQWTATTTSSTSSVTATSGMRYFDDIRRAIDGKLRLWHTMPVISPLTPIYEWPDLTPITPPPADESGWWVFQEPKE